ASELAFWQLYLIFEGVIFLCSVLPLWSLVRLLRRRKRPLRRGALSLVPGLVLPFLWEVVLPLLLLAGFPQLLGVTWPIVVQYFPDLGYWLLAMCLLLLLTGITRIVLVGRKWRRREIGINTPVKVVTSV